MNTEQHNKYQVFCLWLTQNNSLIIAPLFIFYQLLFFRSNKFTIIQRRFRKILINTLLSVLRGKHTIRNV